MACAEIPIGIDTTRGKNVVVIADLRGQGIQDKLQTIKNDSYSVKVLVWRGRGVKEAVKESKQQLIWTAPDIIIILAGISPPRIKTPTQCPSPMKPWRKQ